jgi:hypothetical protein
VTPRRERVIAAKVIVMAVVGAELAVVCGARVGAARGEPRDRGLERGRALAAR